MASLKEKKRILAFKHTQVLVNASLFIFVGAAFYSSLMIFLVFSPVGESCWFLVANWAYL